MCRYAKLFLVHYVLSASIGIFGLCFFALAQAQDANNGEEFVNIEKSKKADTTALKRSYAKADIPLQIILSPVTPAEKSAFASRPKNEPLRIGFKRDIPAPYNEDLKPLLSWVASPEGGHTAVFTVTSPDASALRLALQTPRMDQGVEVRFFNASMDKVFGPYTAKDMLSSIHAKANGDAADDAAKKGKEELLFWSPVIEGATVGVEIYLPPKSDPQSFSVLLSMVSHLVKSPLDADQKDLGDIGSSGFCNIDLACRATTPSKLGNAVAKILFTENGDTYICTGTLLSDKESDSSIPYFMTANHCISTLPVADTVNSYWFFQRSRCNGPNPTSVTQRTRGAELIKAGASSDFSFLQLNDTLPSGVIYAGWSSAVLTPSSTVIGIHHPNGDLKKWSRGRDTGFANFQGPVNGSGSYIRVIWSQGTTESGSSGSALFDTAGRFRGNLTGGYASCSNQNAPDYYGRFDRTYPFVKRWLALPPTSLSCGQTISSSVQQFDSKEYKIKLTSAKAKLTLNLTNLTKDADLRVRRNNRPTLRTYSCASLRYGTASETCTLSNSGNNSYYVRVRGYSSGSTGFKLRASCAAR